MSTPCDYCGLPVPAPLWDTQAVQSSGPQYCCFGCKLAHSLVQEAGAEGASRWALTQLGLAIFLTMNVMVCTFALWAFDSGGFDVSDKLAAAFAEMLRFACMLLALPVLFLLGRPILENAWDQLRRGVLSTDLLLLSGVAAAFGYSIISVWQTQFGWPPGQVYFEVGCMILVMVSLGRWLEATGKLRSTQALDQLQKLLPAQVQRTSAGGTFETVDLATVDCGDELRVCAGERIPTDGVLASSVASIDEQLISGESWPREKQRGDELRGGTLNLAGDLLLTVTAPANAGTLARLIAAVREAREQKGEYEQLADRLSRWFFPAILCIAAGTLLTHTFLSDAMTGLMAALSVVLIACPCALGLATPIAIWAAMGAAARRGIVFRSPEALEKLASARAIRFDKTGTLTTGQPQVHRLVLADGVDRVDVCQHAFALAEPSSHVFSKSIVDFVEQAYPDRYVDWKTYEAAGTTHWGRGVSTTFSHEATVTALGNRQLMEDLGLVISSALNAELIKIAQTGQPLVLVGWKGKVRGFFVMQETRRASVTRVMDWCQQHDLNIGVLTGDHLLAGERLASELGIPVQAGLTPAEKACLVRDLHTQVGTVVFVGDGVNDAPALAVADVGITLGCGADVTRDSADICLLSDDIVHLPQLIELSRRTVRTIKSNLGWAFGYNFCGVLVAMTGRLHPALAAVLMVGSSVYVIANSLRLAQDDSAASDEWMSEAVPLENRGEESVRIEPSRVVASRELEETAL